LEKGGIHMSIKNQTKKLRLKINSLDDLRKHEKQILKIIKEIKNGGNLFMANPILFLTDIGISLSEKVKKEIIQIEPDLSGLSPTPYIALKNTKEKQKIQFNLKGLFRRKSEPDLSGLSPTPYIALKNTKEKKIRRRIK